jgi:hypothetical protein
MEINRGERPQPFTIIVVGGAAIGMAYAPDHSTSDIDLKPLRNAATSQETSTG